MPTQPPVRSAISPYRNPNASNLSAQAGHSFGANVVSGAVRTYKILADGRRKIGAFYLPGDIFGLEAGTEHQFSADAIGPTVVRVIRRSAVLTLL